MAEDRDKEDQEFDYEAEEAAAVCSVCLDSIPPFVYSSAPGL